jgi:hypothetical protein
MKKISLLQRDVSTNQDVALVSANERKGVKLSVTGFRR